MTQPPPFQFPSPYPLPGEVLDGKYRVEKILGEGGMGAVAKATHLLRKAPVALKFMSPNVMRLREAVERFVNESVAASQIDSEHVVKIFDVGHLPTGAPYLVMEYLEGVDLSHILQRDGTPGLPPERAVHFAMQALRGLQVAHVANIVHRDMKPSNCFVMFRDGEPDFLKLVDFGISKVQQPGQGSLTQTNSALGTPLYMSPEQARSPRDVDLRTDLYSTGVILYEMLSGKTPYTADSGEFTELLFKLFTTDPIPLETLRPDLPPGLCQVVRRALAREREGRFQTALEFGEELAPWGDDRAHVLLSRMRVYGRSSMAPARPSSVGIPLSIPKPAALPRSFGPEASARTQASSIPAPLPERPAPMVGTAGGMVRDPQGARKRPFVWFAIPLATAALGLGAIGTRVVRERGRTAVSSEPVLPPTPEPETRASAPTVPATPASALSTFTPTKSPTGTPSTTRAPAPPGSKVPEVSKPPSPGPRDPNWQSGAAQ